MYQTEELLLLAREKSELISGIPRKAWNGGGIYKRHEAAQEKTNINVTSKQEERSVERK
jgi:hypothetical protein